MFLEELRVYLRVCVKVLILKAFIVCVICMQDGCEQETVRMLKWTE